MSGAGAGAESVQRGEWEVKAAGGDMVARTQIQERRALVREQVGAYSMALRETTRGRKLAAVVDSAESHAVQARLLALWATPAAP